MCLGAPQKALTQAAANEAGWQDLLKNAAWWVGEHANLAANEFAGHLPPPEHTNENEARPEEAANHLERTALQVCQPVSRSLQTTPFKLYTAKLTS